MYIYTFRQKRLKTFIYFFLTRFYYLNKYTSMNYELPIQIVLM